MPSTYIHFNMFMNVSVNYRQGSCDMTWRMTTGSYDIICGSKFFHHKLQTILNVPRVSSDTQLPNGASIEHNVGHDHRRNHRKKVKLTHHRISAKTHYLRFLLAIFNEEAISDEWYSNLSIIHVRRGQLLKHRNICLVATANCR